MSEPRQNRPRDMDVASAPRLITLGGCRLSTHGALPGGMRAGRPLALLVYLAMRDGQRVHRDELAELFWGHQPLPSRSRNLRQALYVVGQALPGVLLRENRTVELSSTVGIDALEFTLALKEGRPTDAITLYGGPFLEGFSLTDSAPFSHWVDGCRADFQSQFRRTVIVAINGEAATGAWREADSLVSRLLTRDLIDLEAALLRIDILEKWDRPDEAWVWAGEVARRVAEHTDYPFDPEHLTQLDEVRARLAPTEASVRLGQPTRFREPTLSGREDELRLLMTTWAGVESADGAVVLVRGAPGVGKTRLIQELLRPAALDGATILRGKSYAMEDGLLYGALVDVMRQALHAPGFAGLDEVWLRELARLLPELNARYPEFAESASSGAASGRRRFHEAVAQVFEALAYEAPVICLLDDLHWADEATLQLLHYLVRRLCAERVLILVGLRPGESSDTLRRLQRVLIEEQGGVTIDLPPLAREDVRALVTSMAHGAPPPVELERTVWNVAEGNPFLVVATVRSLEDSGAAALEDGQWRVDAAALEPDAPALRGLVQRRLHHLPEPLPSVLEAAALMGRGFEMPVLAEVAQLPMAETALALESLRARGFLERRDNGTAGWDFTHDRFREGVLEEVTDERRKHLHERIAVAFASTSDKADGLQACRRARHYAQAGDTAEAYRLALVGAEWARTVFAYGGELEMLELAAANAPDPEAGAGLARRLAALRSQLPGSEAANGSHGGERTRWRPAALAGSLALLVAVLAWPDGGGPPGAAAAAGLAPLPEGVLVYQSDTESPGFAVLDPDVEGAPLIPVATEQLAPSYAGVNGARLRFSPDFSLVAYHASGAGRGPDVFVERRDGQNRRRLTSHPEDDTAQDWLPDGTAVVVSTLRDRTGDNYGNSVAIVPLNGGPIEVITHGPGMDKVARVSPDGTTIAVGRLDGDFGIWLVDVDGSDERALVEGIDNLGPFEWSPAGDLIAFLTVSDTGTRLMLVDVETARVREITGARGLSGPPVWTSDGSGILFASAVSGNREVYRVPAADGDPRRLTWTSASEHLITRVGPRPPYIARVEIANISTDTVRLWPGAEKTLTAPVWDSEDNLRPGKILDWHCVNPAVCRVEGRGRVVALSVGTTQVVADLSGWRADTVQVEVVDVTPRLVLSEGWEDGIDRDLWVPHGVPAPEVREAMGRDGSAAFLNNGDSKFNSGVQSVSAFDGTRGLTLEVWGRGDFDTPRTSWQGLRIGFSSEPPPASGGDVGIPAVISVTISRDLTETPVVLVFAGFVLEESPEWNPREWHHYVLQVLPNGDCETWLDGERLFVSPGVVTGGASLWVVLQGRASHAPILHDDVRVWEGIRYR